MKNLIIPYFEHPDLDYPQFTSSEYYSEPGFHKLKDQIGTYLIYGGQCNAFISVLDTKLLLYRFDKHVEAPVTPVVSSILGISEDAMLAAIAIAQKPELAPQLLALRQTSK